jgi:thymidylate synthase
LDNVEFIKAIKTNPEFAKTWGDLGPIYGKQWRQWQGWMDMDGNEKGSLWYDQILRLVHSLKTNPDSRRLMVSAWNVGELDQMVLPPCHFSWQCYSHEQDGKRYLSLAWNQRSVDVGLGLPFNIASYALLLEIIAKEVGMIPYEVIGNLGDCHIYKNHIDGIKEQLNREPYDLPSIEITEYNWYQHEKVKEHLGPKSFNDKILSYRPDCFKLINYQSHPTIKLSLSN